MLWTSHYFFIKFCHIALKAIKLKSENFKYVALAEKNYLKKQ